MENSVLSLLMTDDSFVQKLIVSFLMFIFNVKMLDVHLYMTCESRNATEKVYFQNHDNHFWKKNLLVFIQNPVLIKYQLKSKMFSTCSYILNF